jgi:hypothetical protein
MRVLPRERRNGRPVYADSVRERARELRDSGHSMPVIASILESEGVVP